MDSKTKEDSTSSGDAVNGRLNNFCELCIIKGDMNIAKAFCETCNKLQCNDCIEGHNKYPGLTEHTFRYLKAADQNLTELSLKDISICKKHKKDVEFFCKDHKIVICSSCFIAEHRSCKNVEEITAIATDADVKLREVRGKFQELGKEVNEVIDKFENLKETVSRQVEELPDVTMEKGAHLYRYIRKSKNNLVLEINSVKKKYLSMWGEKEILCKFILDECKKSKDTLTNIPESNAKEMFLAQKKIEKRFQMIKNACKALSEVKDVDIFFEFEEPFQIFEKTKGSIGTLEITQIKPDK